MLIRDARKGLTPGIRDIAKREGVDADRLRSLIASGHVAVPRNVSRDIPGCAVGKLMSTKVNANVGTSKDYDNPAEEVEKARVAVKYGADAVMDLSTGRDDRRRAEAPRARAGRARRHRAQSITRRENAAPSST